MPTGQKAIDWTAENDAKLFLTILAVENVHPNCEKVAAAFGGSVNAVTITNHLNRLRKKAIEQGLIPASGTVTAAKGGNRNGAGKKGKREAKNGSTVLNSVEADTPAPSASRLSSPPTRKTTPKTQKVLTGRVTKAQKPRLKNAKQEDKLFDDDELANAEGGTAEESELKQEECEVEDGALQIKDEEDDLA